MKGVVEICLSSMVLHCVAFILVLSIGRSFIPPESVTLDYEALSSCSNKSSIYNHLFHDAKKFTFALVTSTN